MELSKLNHVTTKIMEMLTTLRTTGVINYDQVNILLPVIVSIALKNETVQIEVE